jgi:hypothetical protein
VGLDLHTLLGTHKNALTVYVRCELYAFFGNLTKLRKRKHLESAAVGKYGTVPIHKLMKSTELIDKLVSGTDMKMIGIGKLNLTANFTKILGRDTALNCSASTYVHKYRCLDVAVYGMEYSAASAAFLFQ